MVEKIKEASGEKLVILDFIAQWCNPCKAMAPIIDEVSSTNNGVEVFKIDIEQETDLVTYFNIRSVPTFIFINKSVELERLSGTISKEELNLKIKKYI